MTTPTSVRTDDELMSAMADGVACQADPLLGGRRWTLRKHAENIGSASTYSVDAMVRKGLARIENERLVLTVTGEQVSKALRVRALLLR